MGPDIIMPLPPEQPPTNGGPTAPTGRAAWLLALVLLLSACASFAWTPVSSVTATEEGRYNFSVNNSAEQRLHVYILVYNSDGSYAQYSTVPNPVPAATNGTVSFYAQPGMAWRAYWATAAGDPAYDGATTRYFRAGSLEPFVEAPGTPAPIDLSWLVAGMYPVIIGSAQGAVNSIAWAIMYMAPLFGGLAVLGIAWAFLGRFIKGRFLGSFGRGGD
jgi:hypothetical protein